VCLSLPTRVGADGAEGIVLPPLNDDEIALLHHSAETLAESLSAIDAF
jgi:malate/lactate dehydrogenase